MIIGERIRLRALERSDLPQFLTWLNDPEVTENLFLMHPLSMEEEEKWFEGMNKRPLYERPLCIEVREPDHWHLIGNLSLMDFQWTHRSAELGIVIGDKAHWNQGYGTEAINLLVKHAFDELNLHRVWLRVYDTNPGGMRCYEKVGFQHEGTLREAVYKHGEYINMHVMSILRHEWHQDK
jgi:RimJ/RimL family protein N-acetyltransferase